ncbi:MAG TPA: maleylacetoacetate isomerase [Steroidobacteraceae bacterium]|nr:maleylacetoacetate isomerase [Steroidobacteraceae bacterium]
MRLYTFWRSSAAFRARIALNLKGLRYESVAKRLVRDEHRAAEFLRLNPQGLIPALEDDGFVLGQSLAIIEYLDETHPEPPLLPPDARGRAVVRSLAQAIACDIHPLNNLRVLNYLKGPLGQDAAGVERWYQHWIAAGFAGLEELARRHSGDGRHLYGGSVTLADVCLVPQLYNARRFHCELAPYPTLTAIGAALEALPAFAAARPEAQPDAD